MSLENPTGNAIEGQSYTGKSTTLEQIKTMLERGVIVVPEYSIVGELPKFPPKSRYELESAINQILDLEKRRSDFLVNASVQKPGATVVYDRGPISCIAFEHAAEKNGYRGAALWLAEAFQKAFSDQKIIVPRGMLHFTASGEIIEERERADLASGRGNILPFLKVEGVIAAINETFALYKHELPLELFMTMVTDNKDPNQIAIEVLKFIDKQKEIGPNPDPDFVAFARKLG